jgi:hypothetical protein
MCRALSAPILAPRHDLQPSGLTEILDKPAISTKASGIQEGIGLRIPSGYRHMYRENIWPVMIAAPTEYMPNKTASGRVISWSRSFRLNPKSHKGTHWSMIQANIPIGAKNSSRNNPGIKL